MKSYTTTQIIAKEGWKYISTFLLITVLSFIAGLYLIAFIALLLTLFNLYLFRNPEREPIAICDGVITSPIDGVISSIESEENFYKIKIIHHFFRDSHILRAPLGMKIEDIKRRRGLFLDIEDKKANRLNETLEIFADTKFGKIVMKLIPSQLSREINFFDREEFIAGGRFGLLMDGALELYLPKIIEIQTEVGEKLIARNSIIAKIQN